MNLPNAITVARIALVPLFVYFAYQDSTSGAVVAFALFVGLSLSDSLDGYLARRWDIITRAGQFLDPTADKLLIGAALWVLVDDRHFPLIVALLIAFREIAVQILRTQIVSAGGNLPASGLGKLKTFLQVWMVSWWLLPFEGRNVGHWMLTGAALAVTLWSGLVYFVEFRKQRERIT